MTKRDPSKSENRKIVRERYLSFTNFRHATILYSNLIKCNSIEGKKKNYWIKSHPFYLINLWECIPFRAMHKSTEG